MNGGPTLYDVSISFLLVTVNRPRPGAERNVQRTSLMVIPSNTQLALEKCWSRLGYRNSQYIWKNGIGNIWVSGNPFLKKVQTCPNHQQVFGVDDIIDCRTLMEWRRMEKKKWLWLRTLNATGQIAAPYFLNFRSESGLIDIKGKTKQDPSLESGKNVHYNNVLLVK